MWSWYLFAGCHFGVEWYEADKVDPYYETKKNNAKQISNDTRLNELRRWFESIGDCV